MVDFSSIFEQVTLLVAYQLLDCLRVDELRYVLVLN
jgi:hypothetical protein